MHSGERYSTGPDLAGPPGMTPRPTEPRPDVSHEAPAAPAARRWLIVAAWTGGGLALLAFLFRISLSSPHDSDGANSALQAWDMLHGNLLLHGWIVGDATFYTFELPLYAITEAFLGLHSVTIHLGAALTYLIVAASAVALARVDSWRLSSAARCGVVIAVLAAPLLTMAGIKTLLELPDHTGTAAILLLCFLLIDRAAGRRYAPLVLGAILIAGQLSDATVLYVAVPAVLVVSAYRVLATVNLRPPVNLRASVNLRTGDAANAVAAVASVPLAVLARAVIVHLGGYAMIPPHTKIAPIAHWAHNGVLALQDVVTLFGISSQGALGTAGAVFGLACLLAAVCGFGKVVLTWRIASRAEQLLCAAIVINIVVYIVSSMPTSGGQREIVAVLPCGAVLAARACVPGRITGAWRSWVAIAAAAVVALVPLAAAAAQPPATPVAAQLATWLEAHGLTYGIGGYWDASAVTVQSGDRVQVRAIALRYGAGPVRLAAYDWETDASWYDASLHDATFVIADRPRAYPNDVFTAAVIEKYLHRPAAIYRVAGHVILIYRTNLLREVVPALPLNNTWG